MSSTDRRPATTSEALHAVVAERALLDGLGGAWSDPVVRARGWAAAVRLQLSASALALALRDIDRFARGRRASGFRGGGDLQGYLDATAYLVNVSGDDVVEARAAIEDQHDEDDRLEASATVRELHSMRADEPSSDVLLSVDDALRIVDEAVEVLHDLDVDELLGLGELDRAAAWAASSRAATAAGVVGEMICDIDRFAADRPALTYQRTAAAYARRLSALAIVAPTDPDRAVGELLLEHFHDDAADEYFGGRSAADLLDD